MYGVLKAVVVVQGRMDEGKREILLGVPVYQWWSQAKLAQGLGSRPNTVRNMEKNGLPCRWHRSTKEYPVPHAIICYEAFQRRCRKRGNDAVGLVDFGVILAERNLEDALERQDSAIGWRSSQTGRGRLSQGTCAECCRQSRVKSGSLAKCSARGGIRTRTGLPPRDFKSA